MQRPAFLIHVSETPDVGVFAPRPAADGRELVWALHPDRIAHYLLPRDCPRVCLRPAAASAKADLDWLASLGAPPVILVERRWLARIRAATLFLYRLPPGPFVLDDEAAGYFVSREAARPLSMERVGDLQAAVAAAGASLVAQDDLWPAHDRAAASTLAFSMIRMRNARAREGVS